MTLVVKSGPWPREVVEAWLRDTVIPIRLATAGKHGPLVQSLWFAYDGDSLLCATQRSSVLAKRVAHDARVGWEVSPDTPPYRGVRGTGVVELIEDEEAVANTLRMLINRYGQSDTQLASWLLGRISDEVVISITQLRTSSWDYAPRMEP